MDREFAFDCELDAWAEYARRLEASGLLEQALRVWRGLLEMDGNYLPAWEASSRLLGALARQDGRDTP